MEKMENEQIAFQLILHAGDARSLAMEAIYASREGNFEEADKKLKEAHQKLVLAHKSQSNMLFGEANGTQMQTNVLLCHAMDHLSMAIITCDIAEEVVMLRKERR